MLIKSEIYPLYTLFNDIACVLFLIVKPLQGSLEAEKINKKNSLAENLITVHPYALLLVGVNPKGSGGREEGSEFKTYTIAPLGHVGEVECPFSYDVHGGPMVLAVLSTVNGFCSLVVHVLTTTELTEKFWFLHPYQTNNY